MSARETDTMLFSVDGMTCQNCARHTREAAEGVPGVAGASVDLGAGRLRLRWKEGAPRDVKAIEAAIRTAGYSARELEAGTDGTDDSPAKRGWWFNLVMGGAVTLFLMVSEWVFGWGHKPWFAWVALALALPVQVFGGAGFYRGAWRQLRQGSSNMDTLVALGSTAAFAFSVWVTLTQRGAHVYFMESAAIITLVSAGHWIEAAASQRAAGAIRALMDLSPPIARRREPDGTERGVPAADLLPGDEIVIRPGDRVPADAEVVEGASAVDEAMLTGESKPVEKRPGTPLFAGTLNVDGRLRARVSATGAGTVLSQIVAAVERAQNSRAGIQRLADQVSSVFVPIVIGLALLTAMGWGFAAEEARAVHAWFGQFLWPIHLPDSPIAAAVVHATAVLIIACPCAMGLATPAAIMAGTNAAALRGILVRDGVALEKAGGIDTIVFDKTGTLTLGRLTVARALDLRSADSGAEPVEALAAAVAHGSDHPVSRALAEYGRQAPISQSQENNTTLSEAGDGPGHATDGGAMAATKNNRRTADAANGGPWIDWREFRGRGMEARRAGETSVVYRLGSLAWLQEQGVEDTPASSVPASGQDGPTTVVGLSAGSRLLALFELQDTLRPDARAVVSELHRQGLDVYLLSGDGWLAAEAVAKVTGIPSTHVLAQVRPEQKAETLARIQGQGRRVAFVGDGINDGPALARADLGIAVSRAADIARESADILLIGSGLTPVLDALGLAKATLRTIRQNLFWAFFYNAAAVPLAMLGFFSPVVCALAMGISDLVVMGNALRLRYWTLAGPPLRGNPSNSPRDHQS